MVQGKSPGSRLGKEGVHKDIITVQLSFSKLNLYEM